MRLLLAEYGSRCWSWICLEHLIQLQLLLPLRKTRVALSAVGTLST
jgi:hypothetical protein